MNKKVIRFRTYTSMGNPVDLEVGHKHLSQDYKVAEIIEDIYLESVDYGDHSVDYVVAVYANSIQKFVASKLDYFELARE